MYSYLLVLLVSDIGETSVPGLSTEGDIRGNLQPNDMDDFPVSSRRYAFAPSVLIYTKRA